MNRSPGFTLIELLVCISVIAIVFAIVTPIFQHVRERGRVTSAVSYMHQIGKAISIYRADWEVSGGYNSRWEAGLPTNDYVNRTGLGIDKPPLKSPCGYKQGIGWDNTRRSPDYLWVYISLGDPFPAMERTLQKYQENTLLVFDPWCNQAGNNDWFNQYADKRVIGLLLSGRVINRKKGGVPHLQEWWASPPP